MEKPIDQTAVIMNRLQEREKEQMLTMAICKALSEVLTKNEFHTLASSLLKDHLFFEEFILASSNEEETGYEIFYQYTNPEILPKAYTLKDSFFDLCLASADTVVFDLKDFDESKNRLPDYLHYANNKNFNNGIGICLPYIKGNQHVLFLFFKNAATLTRESNRIIRSIAQQLSITTRNIKLASEYGKALAELEILKKNFGERKLETKIETQNFQGLVGNSAVMQNVYELITQVASSDSTVLIFGETGTGKELIANAIHSLSLVSNEKIIKVNCASIPEHLIESILFGHEKGAFTGATDLRIGKFEQANNGTIFLDEIGELPLELQGKLLRVLQEKEIERIGGRKTIKINVRVIAATNKSLEREVSEGRFRSDLYYRLNVFPIALPALRNRTEDIEDLANFFLAKHSQKIGKKIKGFSKKVLKSMISNPWPGNVRELENMVERSILFAKEEVIKEMSFPEIFIAESSEAAADFYIKKLQEVEKEHILKVVKKCGGRISGPQGAAILLGLPGTTLISKMQKLGIKKEHFLS
ncbi:sigma-54 interaction domain-containing protein [Flavobacterium procerum]|uniref:Sigma-54 interaction domain-containing protein n=1 Tax=Flavobacterium procerum TaxID=1455569 RepID=A0ABV6BYF6_9FLAO